MNNKSNKPIIITTVLFILYLLLLPTITKRAETKKIEKEAQQARIEASKKKIKEQEKAKNKEKLEKTKKKESERKEYQEMIDSKGVIRAAKLIEIQNDYRFLVDLENIGLSKFEMVGLDIKSLSDEQKQTMVETINEITKYDKDFYVEILNDYPNDSNEYYGYIWYESPSYDSIILKFDPVIELKDNSLQGELIKENLVDVDLSDNRNKFKEEFLKVKELAEEERLKEIEDWKDRADIMTAKVIDIDEEYNLIVEHDMFEENLTIMLGEVDTRFVLDQYKDEAKQKLKELILNKEVYIGTDYLYNTNQRGGPHRYIGDIWLVDPRQLEEPQTINNYKEFLVNAIMVSEGYFSLYVDGKIYTKSEELYKEIEIESYENNDVKWWKPNAKVGRNPETCEVIRREFK